ncbi:MAG: nucleotidyltransferase domain-containing protein [Polaromonas sp.]
MTIDLTPAQSQEVCNILRKTLASQSTAQPLQAWVFGSRATGHARPFSDLDILITKPTTLGWRERADLTDALEASDLPFRVDVVEAARLSQNMTPRVMAERKILL